MTRIALLGFANSGKTTLFNVLTGLEAATAPHPHTTTESNIGVLKLDDPLLDRVADLERSRKVTRAGIDLHDLPAVRSGSVRRLGAGKEPGALLVVLRGFGSEMAPTGDHGADPVEQAEELLVELAVSDFEVFDRRRIRIAKEASAEPGLRPAAEAIARASELLAEGKPLRMSAWSEPELAAFRDLAPLSLLPCIWVVNTGDVGYDGAGDSGDVTGRRQPAQRLKEVVPPTDPVLGVCALLEEELMQLDPDDRAELSEGLGIGEGARPKVVRAIMAALGLITFYTMNPRESRAWMVDQGATARQAAGKIHSDLERGFIRAEVAPIEEVIRHGGWTRARSTGGVVRVEGKDYLVQDGDVLLVRFSV